MNNSLDEQEGKYFIIDEAEKTIVELNYRIMLNTGKYLYQALYYMMKSSLI